MILSYDAQQMRDLLMSFYALTQIRIVVFDADFRKIAEYPEGDCRFCQLIRRNPEAEQRCLLSDREACERSRHSGQLLRYTCHAGLSEAVAPIRHGQLVIGYLMLGQVLLREDDVDHWPEVWHLCSGLGASEQELMRAYREKRPVELEQVFASARILDACAGYLWLSRMISLGENSLPRALQEHIEAHLDQDLSAAALCERFSVSRSRLYRVSKQFFGIGIESLIRTARMQRAQQLLQGSAMPVHEVAARVGFSDYNYFIKVFRRHAGMTPSAYRKS